MTPIRALLVDDEEPARKRLRGLLAEYDEIEIVGEAIDGDDALAKIRGLSPELVFLDIQMPGTSGLEVAAALEPPRPRILFCTAFDQFAIEAFEHHASDYLLKPVARKRLHRAVDRARLAILEQRSQRSELASATRTQARLLPQSLPPMDRLEFAGTCRPAAGVGGDYYDFFALGPGRLGLALGDVSGKGLFAGLLVAGLQARLQSMAATRQGSLAELIADVGRHMQSTTDSNRYATLFYGEWDDEQRTLDYVNAGHTPPFVVRSGAAGADDRPPEILPLPSGGPPVGLLPDGRYVVGRLELQPGDLLIACSDGVTEAPDAAGEEFGEERLAQVACSLADREVPALRDALFDAVDAFTGGPSSHDDATLIVARVR